MAQHKASENVASPAIITPCFQIQQEIDTKTEQLDIWLNRLEAHLSDENSEVSEGEGIRNNIRDINSRLLVLKVEQKRLGCISNGSTNSGLPQDNQTIISTSAVRRKDARALEVTSFYGTTQKKK